MTKRLGVGSRRSSLFPAPHLSPHCGPLHVTRTTGGGQGDHVINEVESTCCSLQGVCHSSRCSSRLKKDDNNRLGTVIMMISGTQLELMAITDIWYTLLSGLP